MPNRRIGTARQIVFILADRDMSNAPTLGDLADILGLRTGTAIGERLREARHYYHYDIRHVERKDGDAKSHCYWMPSRVRERVRKSAEYQRWVKTRRRKAA